MITSKFSKREKALLAATIAITAAVLSYGFVIEPVIDAYTRVNRGIRANTLKLEKSYRLLRREEDIKDAYSKYAELIKPMPSDEEEVAAMLKAIEAIASSNGIYVTNIRPQPARDKGFYKEFAFELIGEAGIDKLVRFIYDLQNSGNLLKVRKLVLSSSGGGDDLKAVMEITKPSIPAIEL
jgi:Tfp pilus assembly protein PilO